ncbi:hypothetical protein ANN_07031 [Periplaneta americana]|uniref:Uncharacterized protein n=1 Tax=Periplaneta americana TaxID=6978 RepID=A0ABQ8THS3_PERAM|nr:hypothetical protein ANN_07031 [Periplaneta americana]
MAGLCEGGNEPQSSLKARVHLIQSNALEMRCAHLATSEVEHHLVETTTWRKAYSCSMSSIGSTDKITVPKER